MNIATFGIEEQNANMEVEIARRVKGVTPVKNDMLVK